jgi:formylglycine-generating enzyme required for sulfatase activity
LAAAAFGPSAAAQAGAAGTVFSDCDTCPDMVVIPAGAFVMGTVAAGSLQLSPGEQQATPISVPRPYALGRTEVTRSQFARFAEATGHEPRPGCRTWDVRLQRFADDGRRTWVNPGVPGTPAEDHPVGCVSWLDARAYADWLARTTGKPYRLPSEAEWEYAARAGGTTLRPWGDSADAGCEYANTYDLSSRAARPLGWTAAACHDGEADVARVALYRPNAFGLHDLIGNLAEWTEDCATASYAGRPKDARAWVWTGGCKRRVVRGGSWADPAERNRSAWRGEADEAERGDTVGFRVALDLEPASGEAR